MTPTDLAHAFVGRINAHDADGLARLMTEDFVFTDYTGQRQTSREVMRDAFGRYFESCLEYRIHVAQVLLSGSDSALIFGHVTGSHLGEEIEKRGMLAWKAEVRDGLVAEWRIYANPAALRGRD